VGRRAVCIGGGITGVLTGLELRRAGWDVTVLEARHVGAGSSSRTAAGIRQQFSTPETVRGMRHSVAWYQAFGAEIGQSPLVQNGYLFLSSAAQWPGALARVDMQRGCGLREVEALAGAELRARFPWVADEHAGGVVGGTFCPTDGFLLPHLVYQEGARLLRERGGRVVLHREVSGAVVTGDRLDAVLTDQGPVSGDVFFDCTNAWTRRTSRALGALELPVEPLKRYLWFLERGPSVPREAFARMPLVVTPGGVYCRPENADSLLVGKAHATPPEHDFTYDDQDRVEPQWSHQGGTDAHVFEVWAELAASLPAVGEFPGFTATTSGFYATTPDHNPWFGYDPLRRNLVHLVGFSGHGAMFGPFTARCAVAFAEAGRDVDHVLLDDGPVSLAAFAMGRDPSHAEVLVI
jgi:sarcosine oxidase subunit beta